MNRIRWWIERSCLGWPGVAALALLAAALLGQAVAVPAMLARLEALSSPATRAAGRDDEPARRLDRFYRHFREAGHAQGQLAKLHRIATANGIALRQGEYRMLGEGDGRLRPYQVTLPVAGTYPAVRRFLTEALDELPTAALDRVTFERKRIGDRGVEAQVRLTLYLGQRQ